MPSKGRVVVVGGGIGGLTSALLFQRRGIPVTLLTDNMPRAMLSTKAASPDEAVRPTARAIGLWSPSMDILGSLGLLRGWPPSSSESSGSNKGVEVATVGLSAYRSAAGKVLATPTLRLDGTSDPSVALGFVDEAELLAAMEEQFVENRSLGSSDEVHFGESVIGLDHGGSGAVICESGRKVEGASLVVAADGPLSALRRALAPTFGAGLSPRGYVVCRGVANLPTGLSFQTWGQGCRFAAVPAPRGQSAWFAAISTSCVPNELRCDIQHAGFHGLVSDGRIQNLVESTVSNWRTPIRSLLESTFSDSERKATVTVQAAVASPRVVREGPSRVAFGAPVAFVGDAAHVLDPILAQGSGVAVEDAASLVNIVCGKASSSSLSSSLFTQNPPDVALQQFDTARRGRLARLQFLSDISQRVGHMENQGLINARDAAMRYVPGIIGSRVFDSAIRYGLGGRQGV